MNELKLTGSMLSWGSDPKRKWEGYKVTKKGKVHLVGMSFQECLEQAMRNAETIKRAGR